MANIAQWDIYHLQGPRADGIYASLSVSVCPVRTFFGLQLYGVIETTDKTVFPV